MASFITLSDAARYFSMSSGDIESTSPMLSNPYPTSSEGKSSAGRMVTPSKSRTVLLYSSRFSLRRVTLPGSASLQSWTRAPSIQFTNLIL